MPEPVSLIVAALAIFVGAAVAGAIGFGVGMMGMPVLLLVLEPQTAVVTVNTLAFALDVLVLASAWRYVQVRQIWPMAVAGGAGAPIGVFILTAVSATWLKIGISSLIILLTVALFFGSRRRLDLPSPHIAGPGLAFIVGIIGTALGVGGPLIAIAILARRWGRQQTRASLVFAFIGIDAVSFLGYSVSGLYTLERVVLIAAVAPALVAGMVAGGRLLRRMNEALFRRVIITVIILSSLMVLVREIWAI